MAGEKYWKISRVVMVIMTRVNILDLSRVAIRPRVINLIFSQYMENNIHYYTGGKISFKISVIISLGHYYMELQYQFMNAYCCIILSIKYLGRGHFIFIRRTKSPSFPLPESILYGPIPCEVSQVPSNNHKLQISQMA